VHSPMLSNFISEVLDTSKTRYIDYALETLRKSLKKDQTRINITDLGAGSKVYNKNEKTISQIAKSSVSSVWQCRIMFNLVNYLRSSEILELGTSLGVSTLYLAHANKAGNITTIEGDPEVAKIAGSHFVNFNLENINLKVGNFDDVLPNQIKGQKYDLIFIDGNHTESATIKYFEMLMPHLTEKGAIVFDDIHWSPGMQSAWEYVKTNGSHLLSIDLYYFGIIFNQTGMKQKQDVRLIPYKWKPFDLGFFAKSQ